MQAPLAHAHATLVGADPAADSVLDRPPDIVVLHFDEPVTPIVVRVLDGSGRPVSRDDAVSTAGHDVVVPLADRATRGRLVVTYRVTSVDAHVVAGSFGLAVGATAPGAATTAAVGDARWSALLAGSRALLYGSVLLAIGVLLFRAFIAPAALDVVDRRLLRVAAAIGAVAAALQVLGTAALASGAGTPLDGSGLHAALRTSLGPALCIVIAGLVGAALAARAAAAKQRTRAVIATLASAVMACGLASTGHAAGSDAALAMRLVVGLHVIAAGFWLGALPGLWRALHEHLDDAGAIVARFSRVAVGAVIMLVAAGTLLALVQVGSVGALATTRYGLLLLAKLAVVAALLGVALRNRAVLAPRLVQDPSGTALRRSIVVELVLLAVIVVITAALGQAVPPRAVAQAGDQPALRLEARDALSGATLDIVVSPGRVGNNTVVTRLRDAIGRTLDPVEVHFAADQPDAGIEPAHVAAGALGDGRHRAMLSIPVSGTWRVRALVTVSDFEQATFTFAVPIP